MIIQTLLKLVDIAELVPKEFNTLESVDLDVCTLDGLGAVKYSIALIHKDTPIEKVLVALDTPATTYKKLTADMIPKGIMLSQTNKLEYAGSVRTTDIPKKIRSLMNSDTPEETIGACIEAFDEIQKLMDIINLSFKDNIPFNASKQGFIRHHFPSPEFPENVKN